MAVRAPDRLIDLTPPSSGPIPSATFSPTSDYYVEHGGSAEIVETEDQRGTSSELGQSNVSPQQASITDPRRGMGAEANNSNESNHAKRGQNEHQGNHKKRAECLETFQGIQETLWRQFHQMQTIVFDGKEIECTLQELSAEESDISLIHCLRILGNSLTGVRHILKGNIVMMEEAKNTSYSSDAVYFASSSALHSPEQGMSSSGTQSPKTAETEHDLLINDFAPEVEISVTTIADTPGNEPTENTATILPEEAVPFVDTPEGEAAIQLNLEYRPGVTKVYAPTPVAGLQSRRVILKNLPPDATLSQIIRGIRCHGGLVSMMMLNTAPIFGDDTKAIMLEFVYHQSAAEFIEALDTSPLSYAAANGDVYRTGAWLISSSSYGFGHIDKALIDYKYTRVLLLKGFPKECIWSFINAIGLSNIVCAAYDKINDGLTVEFTTLFQAAKADRLIYSGAFSEFYCIDPQDAKFRMFLDDSTNVAESKYHPQQFENPVIPRPEDDMEKHWNRHPYNDYLPPHLRRAAAPSGPTRLSLKTRLALQYDIDESEVDDYLEDLEKHQGTEYRLIGSSITLTRRKWGWSMSAEDETKLLLEITLHEPDWAEYWDEHFKCNGEINRRKWEHYGMVARHRREKAAEQGLDLDTVPMCPKGCEMGCRDIRAAPVAAVVRKFFESSKHADA
ncbi:hypothetical protein V8C42DRAFT_354685 [Trichoderma barbatum]